MLVENVKKKSPRLGLEPTKMISFLQYINFERISNSEFPLVLLEIKACYYFNAFPRNQIFKIWMLKVLAIPLSPLKCDNITGEMQNLAKNRIIYHRILATAQLVPKLLPPIVAREERTTVDHKMMICSKIPLIKPYRTTNTRK